MKDRISIEVLVLKRLRKLDFKSGRGRIIPFPEVFARICPLFCLTKKEAWSVLKSMEEKELIDVVPYHGVRIKG